MATQKALAFPAVGKPLELISSPIPTPSAKQLQLRVTVAALNPHDHKSRDTGLFTSPGRFPHILSNDVAGVVTKIGPEVTKFKVGDRVFTFAMLDRFHAQYAKPDEPKHVQMGLQEYSVTDEDYASLIPEGFSEHDVATLPVNVDACAVGLFDKSCLGIPAPWTEEAKTYDYAGTTLLIIGGGSNCGRFAVQLAGIAGIGKVVVLGGDEKQLKGWGATDVLNRHGSPEEIHARIRAAVGNDLVYSFDAVNDIDAQYIGINALSDSRTGKLARLLPNAPVVTSNITKKEGEYQVKDVHALPHINEVGKGFWAHIGAYVKEGKIVPLKYEVIAEGLDAERVNVALDEYRDGKRNVQPHVRVSQ
jgi:NADPH:quinone reductase-like Zn-dependent oxidoreductase